MILTDIILIYDVNIISININMILICDIMTTMRKQATFTYSLSEKDFEKQIKTIENQQQKQTKGTEELEKQVIKSNAIDKKYHYDTEKNSLEVSRQSKYFYR